MPDEIFDEYFEPVDKEAGDDDDDEDRGKKTVQEVEFDLDNYIKRYSLNILASRTIVYTSDQGWF